MQFGHFGQMNFGGGARGRPKPVQPVDHTIFCGAIGERRHILATYEGQNIKAAPYAVIRVSSGMLVLHAVIIESPAGKLNHWEPKLYDLAQFTNPSASPDCFVPNTLFRSEDVVGEGEILCAVDRA